MPVMTVHKDVKEVNLGSPIHDSAPQPNRQPTGAHNLSHSFVEKTARFFSNRVG